MKFNINDIEPTIITENTEVDPSYVISTRKLYNSLLEIYGEDIKCKMEAIGVMNKLNGEIV